MTGQEPGTNEHWADDAHRYRLDSRIATGGMGEVWRATDTTLGRSVAVKVLKREYADDEAFRTRFASEARHAGALHHPGVAAVYDFGEAAGDGPGAAPRPYLVMELVDGQPLSALLRPGQPLDPQATRDLMAQAAVALGAAHSAGIVHRDVKPANLIITPDRTVKITDFGIARATEGMALTQTGQVMGTPQYLSPEQASGGRATPASDVYSLGVVAFECLVGRRPFTGETPVATALAHLREPVPPLPDSVPADLARVVTRAMAKEPGDRFVDAHAFAAALRDPATVPVVPPPAVPDDTRVLTGAPVPPPPTGTLATPVAPPRRRRDVPWLWIALGIAGLAAAVTLVAVAASLGGGEDPATQPEPREPVSSATSPQAEDTPEQTTPTEPETFDIDEDDYVGREFSEVEAELRELGLVVEREDVDNDGSQEPETVAGVSPTTGLSEGDTVTVSVWRQVEGPPEDNGNGNGGGPGSDGGNGNGNGSGNGNGGEGQG